jgi:hypothetical protein
MGDTGSFVVIYVDSGYFITGLGLDFDCAGLQYRSANTLKSKRTNKSKRTGERNVRINILFRLSWRFVYALQ